MKLLHKLGIFAADKTDNTLLSHVKSSPSVQSLHNLHFFFVCIAKSMRTILQMIELSVSNVYIAIQSTLALAVVLNRIEELSVYKHGTVTECNHLNVIIEMSALLDLTALLVFQELHEMSKLFYLSLRSLCTMLSISWSGVTLPIDFGAMSRFSEMMIHASLSGKTDGLI